MAKTVEAPASTLVHFAFAHHNYMTSVPTGEGRFDNWSNGDMPVITLDMNDPTDLTVIMTLRHTAQNYASHGHSDTRDVYDHPVVKEIAERPSDAEIEAARTYVGGRPSRELFERLFRTLKRVNARPERSLNLSKGQWR